MSEYPKYRVVFPTHKVKYEESGNYLYPAVIEEEEKGYAIIPNPAQIRVTDDDLTFSIEHIKTRHNPAVMYFKFYGFDYHRNLIAEYTSDRMVITTEYQSKYVSFKVPYNTINGSTKHYSDLDHYYFEMYLIGVDSENPLYFNHLQLSQGEWTSFKEYHKPDDEINNVKVGFHNNSYINLYDMSDTFLQIIRPNHEDLTTEELTKSQMTILAPHLPNESVHDDPLKIFYEFMYMTEQRIGVEK